MTDASLKRRRLWHDTRGFTAVFLALTLSVLIGFSALGVETGLWYLIKRVNQSAADVAALSGAMEVAAGKPYQTDICPLAKLGAVTNNFTVAAGWTCPVSSPTNTSDCTSLTSGQVCVNNPPLFGAYAGASFPKHVEVILAQQQTGFLASLWQANAMIDTRAVAGPKAFDTCMIALGITGTDLGDGGGGGSASVTLNNCSFSSNSTSATNPNYSVEFHGGITMTAAAISTAGGAQITGSSNFISPPVTTHAQPVLDPYAGQIAPPTVSGVDVCVNYTSGAHTLTPGWYGCTGNNPAINLGGGTTTFCPGVYLLNGADNNGRAFWVQNNGTIVNMGTAGATINGVACPSNGMNGVTIIATCRPTPCTSGGGFVVGGTGGNTPTVTLSAPTTNNPSGCTPGSNPCIPQQILFYQIASTAHTSGGQPGDSTLAGDAGVSLNGVVYTPSTQITLKGNPTFGSCTELIAAKFVFAGTATMNAPGPTCGIITASVSTLVLLE